MNLNYFKYIITDEPQRALNERHIFNLFVFLISFLFFTATILNWLTDLEEVAVVSLAGSILILSVYIISRFYVYNYKLLILFIIIAFINLNGLFITNFGYRGPIVYAFLTLGMTILFFLHKKDRLIFMVILLFNLLALGFIEYEFPHLFGYYKNDLARLMDHSITLIFSLFTLFFLFYLMLQYIETQKLKAEESDRLKSSFLANMSHQIRTPLNGIVGFGSLLKEENISKEEQSHFIDIILSNSDHLAGLINDLIDISIIEANALDIVYAPINLNSFMDQILKKYKSIIDAKQKDITIYLNHGLHQDESTLFVDKVRLSQVLNNLILNAINYSESESIRLGYEITTSKKQLRFFVKDKGIGISQEDQELIFKPFLKAKNTKHISMGGVGVGLTIANKLVELMGGSLSLESQPNKGTYFFFTIPYYKKPSDIPSYRIG